METREKHIRQTTLTVKTSGTSHVVFVWTPPKTTGTFFTVFLCLGGKLDVCLDCFTNEVGEMVERGTCKRAQRLYDGNVVGEVTLSPRN